MAPYNYTNGCNCTCYLTCILDLLTDSNPHNLSVKLRALNDAFHALKLPLDQTWRGPDDETMFIAMYGRICNTLGYLVPLASHTLIDSQYLSFRDPLFTKYKVRIPNKASITLAAREFVPEAVQLLWILGDEHVDNSSNARTIIYLHGGGYVLCGGASHLGFVSKLSVATRMRVLVIWYKKPPNATIPTQVTQTLTTYFYLMEHMSVKPNDILIGGDSAGAGLAMLLLQKLSMWGLYDIYPFGMFLLSPWVDLTLSSESWKQLDDIDVVLDIGYVQRCSIMAVGYDVDKLKCGLHSALHNDHVILHKLPHMFVMVSRHEALFNDSQNLVDKLQKDCDEIRNEYDGECDITYEIEEHRPHACPIFVGLFDEAKLSFDKIVRIIHKWYD